MHSPLVRVAVAVLAPLPPCVLRAFGRAIGVVAYAIFGSARRIAHEEDERDDAAQGRHDHERQRP